MLYADWEHYSEYYGEITDEKEFDKLIYRASMMIDTVTGNRAASATGYKVDRLRECACSLVNLLASEAASGVGSGLTSFSNDGYSESYAAVTPGDVDANHKELIFNHLSGTGLVSAL